MEVTASSCTLEGWVMTWAFHQEKKGLGPAMAHGQVWTLACIHYLKG